MSERVTESRLRELRHEAIEQLRSLRTRWERLAASSSHGQNILMPTGIITRYYAAITLLRRSGATIVPSWLDLGTLVEQRTSRERGYAGQRYTGVPLSILLAKVRGVLAVVEGTGDKDPSTGASRARRTGSAADPSRGKPSRTA